MTNSKKDSTIQCNKCGKTFIDSPANIACAVMHLDGQCCHYGMKEVVDSKKDTELRERLEEELRQMFMEVGVKLTEIGWEVAEENIQETATKIKALIRQQVIEAKIEELSHIDYRETWTEHDGIKTVGERIKELREEKQ